MKQILTALLVGLAILSGCTPSSTQSSPTPEATAPPMATDQAGTPVPAMELNPELNAGEVPQGIFDSVVADLLSVAGVTSNEVTVVKSEAITWSDGSLGCPQPDVMYTQALVPGYQIIFSIDNRTYDYHVAENGSFVICESPFSPGINEGTPMR